MAANQTQMNPQQQNYMARANLLSTGISMIKRLQPVKGDLNSTVKIPLLRMGVMTGVLLQFSVPIKIEGAAAEPSQVAPWNLAQLVEYKDFAGVSRTRTNGFQLWAAQSLKQGDALSLISAASYGAGQGNPLAFDTNIVNLPSAVGEAEMHFSLYVPMAYDPASDLTGAVLTQTNVGEHYINVQLGNLVGASPWNTPYVTKSGATVTALDGVTVQAFQYYIQPQSMGIDSLPLIDLGMIYGFEGAYSYADNIAAGMSHYINYPNNRSVLSALINFENGNTFSQNGTDLSGITLLANSNTNFQELTPRLVRETMRNICNQDLPGASYYIGTRRQPVQTQLYANVQAKMDVAAVNAGGNTRFISQYEIVYPSGTPLPGIGGA